VVVGMVRIHGVFAVMVEIGGGGGAF